MTGFEAIKKPERQKIPWEMPQPMEIRVTARSEAIGAGRAAVELEAARLGRYRFGQARWEVIDGRQSGLPCSETHSLYGPLLIGRLEIVDCIGVRKPGGSVTALVFNRGPLQLGTIWHWESAEERIGNPRLEQPCP